MCLLTVIYNDESPTFSLQTLTWAAQPSAYIKLKRCSTLAGQPQAVTLWL